MKSKIITYMIACLLMTIFFAVGNAQAQEEGMTCSYLDCCVVTNYDNPDPIEGEAIFDFPQSLKYYVNKFNGKNVEGNIPLCRERISFDAVVQEVHIYEQIVLDNNFEQDQVKHIGNKSSSNMTTWVIHDLRDEKLRNGDIERTEVARNAPGVRNPDDVKPVDSSPAILVIDGVRNVTIENLTITTDGSGDEQGNHGTFIQCINGADYLSVENVLIDNKPFDPAIHIDGCQNVVVEGLSLSSKGTDIPGGFKPDARPFIHVQNSDNFQFNNSAGAQYDNIRGSGVLIENTDGYFLGSLPLDFANDALTNGTGVHIVNSQGTLSDITILDARGNGVKFEDVAERGSTNFNGKLRFVGGNGNIGIGLILHNSRYFTFDNIEIDSFGKNGVSIIGNSSDNKFTGIGVNIHNNGFNGPLYQNWETGGHGIYMKPVVGGGLDPRNNTIENTSITDNFNCGVYINSREFNNISDNNLRNNDECGVRGLRKIREMGTASVIIIAQDDTTSQIDIRPEEIGSEPIVSYEVHQINSTDESQIGDDYIIGTPHFLPADANSLFFVLFRGENDKVLGVWHGRGYDNGETDLIRGCYRDRDTNEMTMIWDPDADHDGDGVPSIEEDDGDCIFTKNDASNFLDPDTDGDGLTDGEEVNILKTYPLLEDSDDDGLWDSEEVVIVDTVINENIGETDPMDPDADLDGLDDGTERILNTDPHDEDTDGDQILDGVDDCPLIHANEGFCMYPGCVPSSEYIDPALGSGDDGTDERLFDDHDGDGIPSNLEDNGNCAPDGVTVELDPLNPDSDGDGIMDGLEDRDRDGVFEPEEGESNPLVADTDGDCRTDYIEIGANGLRDAVTETDPLSMYTDGDGVPDGGPLGEDANCNGVVDKGETAPYLADTDADGWNDTAIGLTITDTNGDGVINNSDIDGDICPWNPETKCVVRFHALGVQLDYDADGDGIPDIDEDTNGNGLYDESNNESHPLMYDTDGDGLSDGEEINCWGTNPTVVDTDFDGVSDFDELEGSDGCVVALVNNSTNPLEFDNNATCSLNPRTDATQRSSMPVMAMMALMILIGLVARQFKKGASS